MKAEFAPARLRCPRCRRDGTLTLRPEVSDAREVREGTLACSACGATFPVRRGVGELMVDAPEHVAREAAGLERFADWMRANGWDRDTVRRLPDGQEDGYWYVQAVSLQQISRAAEPRPGQWLLDVGSNTCWAANHFARRGLNVIALDIALAELQGLYTADYFIEDGTSYFERVLGTMYDIPLASGTLDFVYCCEVLHHNDRDSLRRTFEEIYRVLKPGGRMLVVNETIKTVRDPIGNHSEEVAQFEGYEHAFWAWQYRFEATRAGFLTRMVPPRYHWFYDPVYPLTPGNGLVPRAKRLLRTTAVGRRAYLAYLNAVRGEVQLNFVATKPARRRWR